MSDLDTIYSNDLQGNALNMMRGFGLDVDDIIYDGSIHRVKTFTQPKKNNGYYSASVSGDWLMVGDWQTGLKQTWKNNQHGDRHQDKVISDQKRTELKIAQNRLLAKQQHDQQIAAEKATKLYNSSKNPIEHPYLKAKHINTVNRIKTNNNNLLIPLFDINSSFERVLNIQYIGRDGAKQFMKGGRVKGLCFPIGELDSKLTTLYIAEGFSTAATVHLITNDLVLAAMNAGNLKAVALLARKRWPLANIIIAGDDDWYTQMKTGTNVGMVKAKEAAISVGGLTCFPPFTEKERKAKLTDWNDYLFADRREVGQWKV